MRQGWGSWLTLDKVFHGALEGTAQGQMLAASTDTPGSAGYVALERVTGTLPGRAGTFVLQHYGTMNRGATSLSVTVVPDSGTAQLTGFQARSMMTLSTSSTGIRSRTSRRCELTGRVRLQAYRPSALKGLEGLGAGNNFRQLTLYAVGGNRQ